MPPAPPGAEAQAELAAPVSEAAALQAARNRDEAITSWQRPAFR